jgi:hypothetical protein
VQNLIRHDFCLSVIVGLFQNSLESSLSTFALHVHLQMLGVCMAIISKLFILSYFMICFSRNLTGLCLAYPSWRAIHLFGSSKVWHGRVHMGVWHFYGQGLVLLLLIYMLVRCRLC